ncbi:hypothetical protein EVAR_49653_1 [Eumeta japonica]|uniref:Uncharacterized protein n=1 Tax=Eumeta variegata TaxID=151549 RepID=A0A4C1Y849_EUMVA|nr:hypothetical protein EVAR_49653_1 [Eumeta japonica]
MPKKNRLQHKNCNEDQSINLAKTETADGISFNSEMKRTRITLGRQHKYNQLFARNNMSSNSIFALPVHLTLRQPASCMHKHSRAWAPAPVVRADRSTSKLTHVIARADFFLVSRRRPRRATLSRLFVSEACDRSFVLLVAGVSLKLGCRNGANSFSELRERMFAFSTDSNKTRPRWVTVCVCARARMA